MDIDMKDPEAAQFSQFAHRDQPWYLVKDRVVESGA